MESSDIDKYIQIALRRIWWIIIPFLLTVLCGLTYMFVVPRVYEAETLILVQAQKVPEDFIRSIVTSGIEERLRSIRDQVTSRTNLEAIIQEHQLYDDRDMHQEEKVELLRERIKIEMRALGVRKDEFSSFSIAVQENNPEKAMEVANALASNFITENLKMRESQAMGTSGFLSDELESVRRQLIDKEEELKGYQRTYMGGLPSQLETNLNILERLQAQMEQLSSNLRDAENRRLIIQRQIAESEMTRNGVAGTPLAYSLSEPGLVSSPGQGRRVDIQGLKRELADLETKYTANHPDVVRLKKMISKMEAGDMSLNEEEDSPDKSAAKTGKEFMETMPGDVFKFQLQQVNLEIEKIRSQIGQVEARIEEYRKRIEETPEREQELLSLERDYDNLKALYDSLLDRKLEADIAVSMEKKQKGEQFRVIDPAIVPTLPVKPNLKKVILLTIAIGIGLGGGLAYLMEFVDEAYRTPEEVEEDLNVRVLANIPIRYTHEEEKRIRRKRVFAFATVGVGFILSAVGIVFAAKGVDPTLSQIRDILSRI
jgi:polysaccharide chain length determinant protein (PEP-CTERM system associated)